MSLQAKSRTTIYWVARLVVFFSISMFVHWGDGWAGSKRMMSIRAAQMDAQRMLVESIHGLKVRSVEEVKDFVMGNVNESSESKTSALIKGIRFDEITYDKETDIAKVTASVTLNRLENIDGHVMDLKGKTFQRVGFGTTTPSSAGKCKALRAAVIDAYVQMAKRIVGFTLESRTKVEDFKLASDYIKATCLATLYLAELKEFHWDKAGDAYVTMVLDPQVVQEIVGETVENEDRVIEIVGMGARAN